jgi:hypothetical protein
VVKSSFFICFPIYAPVIVTNIWAILVESVGTCIKTYIAYWVWRATRRWQFIHNTLSLQYNIPHTHTRAYIYIHI